jgi:hypothetical protein
VIFIQLAKGSFVLKPTSQPVQDLFLYYYQKELNIRVPKSRLLSYHDQEFKKCLWKIEKSTFQNPNLQQRLMTRLNNPFWIIMEYIPNVAINQLEGQNASR